MELRGGKIGTSPVSGQIHGPVCPSQGVWNSLFFSSYTPLCQSTYPWEPILMFCMGFEGTDEALLVGKRRRGKKRQESSPRSLFAWKNQVVSTS